MIEEQTFTDTASTDYAGYNAWEARCRELKLSGPHRVSNTTIWQFTDENGTAAIYNTLSGGGVIFRRES